MKGLIYKDFLSAFKVTGIYILLSILLLAVSLVAGQKFISLYAFAFLGMIPLVLIAYDEQEKWNIYSLTLPVNKLQYVSSKYLTGFINLFLCAVIYTVLLFAKFGASAENVTAGVTGMAIGLLLGTVNMPFTFALGYIKGRIANIVFMLLLFGFAGALMSSKNSEMAADFFQKNQAAVNVPVCVILALSSIFLYFLSMLVSVFLYKKRSF